MSTYATWLPDVLRAAGLEVVTYPGWERRGAPGVASHPERRFPGGGFVDLRAVVWHHDASPRGNTPGIPRSMLARWETAAAQLWVDRAGTWHVLAAGVAWHAGAVLAGMPGNWTSLGVETDHTVGEDWPPAQIGSLRTGTAAILTKLGRSASAGLHFHKSICDPPGRKVDPDGLTLNAERATVGALMTNPAQKDDDMTPDQAKTLDYIEAQGRDIADRINKLSATVAAATSTTALATALKVALEGAGVDVDVDELARKIVVELGKPAAS